MMMGLEMLVNRDAFHNALAIAGRIAEKRSSIPILSHVLVEGRGAESAVMATNLDIATTILVPCDAGAKGRSTLPIHMLAKMVKGMPKGADILITPNSTLSTAISCAGANINVDTLDPGDFPNIHETEAPDGGYTPHAFSHSFSLPCAELRALFDQTAFAISQEEIRYYLNGVYFHFVHEDGADYLRAVATDGHRLAHAQIGAPDGLVATMPNVIIPRLAVVEMQRLLAKQSGNVRIDIGVKWCKFTVGAVELLAKNIDGTFPDYSRVIPKGNNKKLVLDRARFLGSLNRLSAVHGGRGSAVKLNIDEIRGEIILFSHNPDGASAKETLPCQFNGANLEIGFNIRYLIEIASHIPSDLIVMRFEDGAAPTIIEANGAIDNLFFVQMPMRV